MISRMKKEIEFSYLLNSLPYVDNPLPHVDIPNIT